MSSATAEPSRLESNAMALRLPTPIDLYFASENAHDVSASEHCFAADAVVRDESRTIAGIDAIKAWRAETAAKYAHRVEPLDMAVHDGRTVVTCRVTGNFPGSPVSLDHIFQIDGDRIIALDIR